MRPRPLVIYHKDCFDGLMAAWCFRHFEGEEADFYPIAYGEDPPDAKGRHVWWLDFSLKREQMKDLIVQSKRTTVYDHHKTAEKELDGILQEIRIERNVQRDGDKIVFDMSRSGAGITYDELEILADRKAGQKTPRRLGARKVWLVDYIEDRDLWKWSLPGSRSISAYLSSVPMTFEEFDRISKLEPNELISQGMAIERYIDTYGDKAIKHATMRHIGGYLVPVINVPYMNSSDHIGKMAERTEAPFAAGFFLRGDGLWQFGLRSRGEFDVSEIAKQYGGGGHKNAAGFQIGYLPWSESGFPMPTSISVETEEGVKTLMQDERGGLSIQLEAPEKEKKDEAD